MKTGVRHLIYATEQDIIFASGFDNDALGWDANTNGLLLRYEHVMCRVNAAARFDAQQVSLLRAEASTDVTHRLCAV